MSGAAHIVVAGLGNIGSQIVPLLGRLPGVGKVTLIDPDSYSEANLATQNIARSDVGKTKVAAQAARLAEVNPHLTVSALPEPVEAVGLGALNGDVIVACVDALAPRRVLSEAAVRLGKPLVDTGVHADGGLARVTVQTSASACLQCGWSERTYERMEHRYVCSAVKSAPSTNAPAWLGAIAASMAAAEIARLLNGDTSSAGRELLFDAQSQRLTVSRLTRREACRCDHQAWPIEPLGAPANEMPLGDLFGKAGAALRVWDQAWITKLVCVKCQALRPTMQLGNRRDDNACVCGGAMLPLGFETRDVLTDEDVPAGFMDLPLSRIGIRDGDVLIVTTGAAHAIWR